MNCDSYERLANAIILQAVKDYRVALAAIAKNPMAKSALDEKAIIEKFFRSPFFGVLTSVDPEYLIDKLNMEVAA